LTVELCSCKMPRGTSESKYQYEYGKEGSIDDVLMPGGRAGIVLATLSVRQRSEKRPENRSRHGLHIERLDDATVAGDCGFVADTARPSPSSAGLATH
jgi:hypothetical protein